MSVGHKQVYGSAYCVLVLLLRAELPVRQHRPWVAETPDQEQAERHQKLPWTLALLTLLVLNLTMIWLPFKLDQGTDLA